MAYIDHLQTLNALHAVLCSCGSLGSPTSQAGQHAETHGEPDSPQERIPGAVQGAVILSFKSVGGIEEGCK